MTSKDVLRAIRDKYRDPWLVFPELRCGTGYGKRSEQRIDAWVIHPYPSSGCKRIAFEIKVDRQDFLNELKDPLKRRGAVLYSNQFYFITPPGLVRPEEVPIECGLMEVVDAGRKKPEGGGWFSAGVARSPFWFREVVDAPVRESILPTWKFVASLARRILREELKMPVAEPIVENP
jgi:hypothetical protein